MELVVVNGSSSIARGVIQSLLRQKSYQKVRLLDYRPYRPAVYQLQKYLNQQGVAIEKHMTQSAANIEIALEGTEQVVYFTHDYVTQSGDKNNFLQATAKMSKKVGVQKLISVCPIEHELYYYEDEATPFAQREEAQSKALSANANQTIINPNLVFGKNSYFIHYMAQCAMKGKIPKSIGSAGNFTYNPVHTDDIAKSIIASLEKFDQVKNQNFTLSGSESLNKKQILEVLQKAVGRGDTSLSSGFNLMDFVNEFMTGTAHDQNFEFMVKYFEQNNHDLTQNDIFAKLGLSNSHKFSEYYQKNKFSDADLSIPSSDGYKQVALD